jgi:phosphinothricin acetyltransferase
MTELLIRARAEGKHVMVAAIESGNTASLRLHEKLGFATVGVLPEVGTKFGRRLGMTLMQITLD